MKARAIISYGLHLERDLSSLLQQIGSKPGRGKARPEIPEGSGDLPEVYGETRLVLLPVHPYLIHAYWEVTPKDLERVKHGLGEDYETAKPVLRFFDITYIEFDGANAHSHFDLEIDLQVNNWKVHLWSPEKSYIAELGFKSAAGEYSPITRSNVAHTPRAWPSIRVKAKYMSVRGESWDVETVPDSTQPGDTQAGSGGVTVNPRGLTEPSPPLDASIVLSRKGDPFYGAWQSGEFSYKSDLPAQIDLIELCEQRFTLGLSSGSMGGDGRSKG